MHLFRIRILWLGTAIMAFVRRQDIVSDRSLLVELLSEHDGEKEVPASERPFTTTSLPIQMLPSFLSMLQTFLLGLVPSFITALFKPHSEPRKLHPTSFLDGLRGYASFIVAHVHLVAAYERWLLPSFGMDNDPLGSNIFQLPVIRLFFSARPMIHIFMVISGYVLSCKAIRLMRLGKYEEMYEVVVSMIFRRGIRLFVPSMAGILLLECSAWMGWQIWPVPASFFGKLYSIYANIGRLVWSWNWDYENDKQLLQLWTIPVEFACSMMLFLVIMGTSRLRSSVRLCVVAALAIHCHACAHWGPFEFLAGMLIAEFQAICEEREKARPIDTAMAKEVVIGDIKTHKDLWAFAKKHQKAFWTFIFFFGLFLAGYPEENAEIDWGFRVFTWFTPQIYLQYGSVMASFFWFSIAACCIVVGLFRVPVLRRFFETPFAQYLGDVSYSVYIVHYYLVLTLEWRIINQAHYIVGGTDTQLKRIGAVVLEILMLMTVVIWQADIFWRVVDKPAVVLARRVEKWCRRPDM